LSSPRRKQRRLGSKALSYSLQKIATPLIGALRNDLDNVFSMNSFRRLHGSDVAGNALSSAIGCSLLVAYTATRKKAPGLQCEHGASGAGPAPASSGQ